MRSLSTLMGVLPLISTPSNSSWIALREEDRPADTFRDIFRRFLNCLFHGSKLSLHNLR